MIQRLKNWLIVKLGGWTEEQHELSCILAYVSGEIGTKQYKPNQKFELIIKPKRAKKTNTKAKK